MYKKHFYTVLILLSFLFAGSQTTFATKQIINDGATGTGGDASSIGTWDWGTLTCTLTQDVYETIQIMSDGITLDGNGHTINLSDPTVSANVGIYLDFIASATIKNIYVTNCFQGILFDEANHINVTDNYISNCTHGIWMYAVGTSLFANGDGIKGNTISNNTNNGIWVQACINVDIYNNNFIENGVQAEVSGGSGINFNLTVADGGGNYWSDYTGLDEVEPFGIGDTPYIFNGGQDNYPLMPTPQTKIAELIDTVEEIDLQQGIDNSLDAKLDAALNALDDVNQNNDVAAINSLNAFINAVETQRGNKITDAQADTLVADANYIINLLGG